MKKLLFGIVLLCLTTASSYSQETALPDSTAITVGKVYNDVKQGLVELGSALKVGATHVYSVLIKQQVVSSIVYLIIDVLTIILICLFVYFYKKYNDNDRQYGDTSPCIIIITGILAMIGIIQGIINLDSLVTGFVNPEYGAIRDIMEFIN